MAEYPYIIVGGGRAGAAAVEGIRQHDARGAILVIGSEPDPPYDRPPLSKQLWTGDKREEEVFAHPASFYSEKHATLALGTLVTGVDPAQHTVRTGREEVLGYQKLLLATGGSPRRLPIPGGDLEGLYYYRTLGDFRRLFAASGPGTSAAVIGGGFIGSEMAAALSTRGTMVTMIFPEQDLVARIFPHELAKHLTDYYRTKGITLFTQDQPTAIRREGTHYLVQTRAEHRLRVDHVVVGIGIAPNITLAQTAGLRTGDGIMVNDRLQTSDADIYAAGDVAHFPEAVLGPRRIEHWDNAVTQGRHAGANMAGADKPFEALPFFFSDLFDFGYEAVGDIDARLEVFADWQEVNKTGVLYYLRDQVVRGVMCCNVWNKVDAARQMIREGRKVTPSSLRGAIR